MSSLKEKLSFVAFFTSILVPIYILDLGLLVSVLIFLAYVFIKGFWSDVLLIVLWIWSGIVAFGEFDDVTVVVYVIAGIAELYFFTIPFLQAIYSCAKNMNEIPIKISKYAAMVLALLSCFVLLFVVPASYNYSERYEKYLEEKLQDQSLYVKIDISDEMTSYNNLGTDIEIVHTCNNRVISPGEEIKAEKVMKLVTFITEHDSVPDEGSGSTSFNLPPIEQSKFVNIRVAEEGGRKYSEAYAIWQITYTITPVVSFFDKILSFFYF